MSGRVKPKKKGRPPAHQNKYAFKHNKNSKKTKKILSLPNTGLCKQCHEIIEWRKKYRKYKPLTTKRRWFATTTSILHTQLSLCQYQLPTENCYSSLSHSV